MQPDFGMAFAATVVWSAQWFLAGLPLLWVGVLMAAGVGGLIAGYRTLDHVQSRIDRFLDPASGDTYQVDTALSAFSSGGLLGRGPGEGVIKAHLPDAHADFIFAVVGEEFGLVACLVLVALFAFVVLRGFLRLQHEEDLFRLLAAAGLLTLFGMQALINMAVSLNLLPTKGMTLPFISYGGSSLLALAAAMGMVLALTRWRARPGYMP
jgi:cell division protein FtsW